MIFALSTHNVLKRLLEKGAAYERLGFPANQKKYAIGFFLFFPPSSFKAKKKAEDTLRNSRFPGCQARITRPNQNVELLFTGFVFDKADFSDGFVGYNCRAYGTRSDM